MNLPLLLLIAFLLGFVPMALWHQAVKWRLRQRLSTAERSIGQLSGPTVAPSAPVVVADAPLATPPLTTSLTTRRPPRYSAMSNRIYVALDTPDLDRAKAIATKVRQHVGGIKLGLEFFTANGRQGVRELSEIGLPVFLDLKLHDIPNTVAKAVMALRGLDPAILTVHAAGGRAMLEDAKAAAPTGTKVVAVTTLTSLDASDLAANGIADSPHEQVLRLTRLAMEAGVDGVVCSGEEVAAAKQLWPKGFFVVPGVRPADGPVGDQKRVVTPRAALDAGASIIVVGRPITQAEHPQQAARAIEATL